VLEKGQRHAEVVGLVKQAVGRGLRTPGLLASQGDAQLAMGNFHSAAESYSEAAHLAPKDPTLWEVAGALRFKLGETEAAESAFRKSLAIQGRTAPAVALAQIYYTQGKRELASKAVDQALEAAPDAQPRELVDLARLLAQLRRTGDAQRLLTMVRDEPGANRNAKLQLQLQQLTRQIQAGTPLLPE